jgi:hypothetical protein
MHHLAKWAIASPLLLVFGLIVSSCFWNLPSIPYLIKISLFHEKAEAPVEPRHRFVRVTPEPVTPVDPPKQLENVEERETDHIEIATSSWNVPLGETVESAPTTQEPSAQATGTTHEDEIVMPASTVAPEEAAPEQLTSTVSRATQAASVGPEGKSAKMAEKVFAPRPEKKSVSTPRPATVIRVHLASLTSALGANREWRELNNSHLDLLDGVAHYIKEANLRGKGTYFRLYAGEFLELKKASAFCSALKTRKQYCKPVSLRN